MGRDALLPPDETQVFGRRRLDRYGTFGDAHNPGQAGFHGWNVRVEFGFLQHDRHVDVADLVARAAHHFEYLSQQNFAVDALPLRIFVGKMVPDVAKVGRAEQRIAENVANDVGVGMALGTLRVRDQNAAEPEGAIGDELVDVVPQPNAKV